MIDSGMTQSPGCMNIKSASFPLKAHMGVAVAEEAKWKILRNELINLKIH